MQDCLFCKIARGEIPSSKLYEDDELLAFYDIDPKAPVHFLVIPKAHITSLAEVTGESSALCGRALALIARLAAEKGLSKGFRVVTNAGVDAGQSVPHLHFHVLAGREMAWPPG